MTKANLVKTIGTVLGVVLAGLAGKYPQYATALASAATLLFGWLHIPQPGTAALPPQSP